MTGDILARAGSRMAAGQPAEALALLQPHLRVQPGDGAAIHLMGLALHALGRVGEALEQLRRAVAIDGGNPVWRGNLARVLAAAGAYAEAEREFRAALAVRPSSVADLAGLGNLLLILGRTEDAAAVCRQALALGPRDWLARLNAGAVAFARGRLAEAADHLTEAARIRPRSVEPLVSLGNVKLAAGQRAEALAVFERALALSPDSKAAVGRARALHELGRVEEALRGFAEAETKNPADAEASLQFAAAAARLGDIDGARAASERALARSPRSAKARWQKVLLLPRIYRSAEEIEECREAWTKHVAALAADLPLDSPAKVSDAVEAVTATTNFDINYQGQDDRTLQTLYGGLLRRVAAARYPRFADPPTPRPTRARPRVGFVSAFLYMHSIYKTHGAWITDLGKDIETYVYYLGNVRDEALARIRSSSARFREVSSAQGLVEAMAEDELDAAVYPDIGMTSRLQLATALWLAPVQCNGLGHPVTSGLSTLTHALSSDLMEPSDGEGHYSERLVRLPNTASCYSSHLIAEAVANAASLDRSAGQVRFLCAQNLQKYLPQHDHLFVDIAAEAPNSAFHFIADASPTATKLMSERLKGAFAKRGLDAADFCMFHPRLERREYFGLNLACDAFLDTPLWSGNNTTHEAVGCGLPVVTWPGPMMRGRHAAGILARIGCHETVASSLEDYVAIAIRIAHDRGWRAHLRADLERKRAALYDDPAPIDSLRKFLLGRVAT